MAHVCSCMSCPCKRYVCPQPCSTLSRIQQRVRMPMTLYTSRQSAFSISVKGHDRFIGPGDRYQTNGTPWGGSKGVAKKHNSYARYLGRLKGPVLRRNMRYGDSIGGCSEAQCCCFCEQTISSIATGDPVLPQVQVGDTVTQGNASGTVIWVGSGLGTGGDENAFIARVDDCENNPFKNGGSGLLAYQFFHGGVLISGTVDSSMITIASTTTCPPPNTTLGSGR